jgi:hypothetical protein
MIVFRGVTRSVWYTRMPLRFWSSCCTHFQEIIWRQHSYLKILDLLTEIPHEYTIWKILDIGGFRRGMLNTFVFLFVSQDEWIISPSFRDSLIIPSYLDCFTSEDEMDTLSVDVGKMWRWQVRALSYNSNKSTNQMQQFYKFITWRFVSLNMFRAPPRTSSGAYNCINSLWFYLEAWW